MTDRIPDYPATLDRAILRFSAVDTPESPRFLPAFLAGYLCATLGVQVDLALDKCGSHADSFRVGHREGVAALFIYLREASE